MLVKLQFKPGLSADGSRYSGAGEWVDGDKVRFRQGSPEKIGGWQRTSPGVTAFTGTARAMIAWSNLAGDAFLGIGTSSKYYIESGSSNFDISPYARTVVVANPFFTAIGTAVMKVTDANHGQSVGTQVTISGSSLFNGVQPNGVQTITSIVDVNSYLFTNSVAATGGGTGGGGAVTLRYDLGTGLDNSAYGSGWSAGTWGGAQTDGTSTGWGSAAPTTVEGAKLRLWSHDIFGQDLIINIRDSAIYYWAALTGAGARAVELRTMTGAASVPVVARQVLVNDQDRRVIAFGCTDGFTGLQDSLLIRWSDAENPVDWAPTDINSAGDLRIPSGSEFIAARETKQEVLVWADDSLHSLRYVGPPYIYGITRIGLTQLIAPNAIVVANDSVFWMGSAGFFAYDGRIKPLPCSVRDYLFDDLNLLQADKIVGGSNMSFNEAWWFYPSAGQEECNRYVAYNYVEDHWTYGTLARTAWIDRVVEDYPRAAGTDGFVYYHELGNDDGSTLPGTAISAFIESGPVEIGSGDDYGFAWRMLPDVGFRNSTGSPAVTMTLKTQTSAGSSFVQSAANTVSRGVTLPIEQFTDLCWFRLRGRSMTLRVSSDRIGTAWRLGIPRVDVRADGKR